jgi:hypothetical protein
VGKRILRLTILETVLLKATKYMISDNATLYFPEKDGDSLIREKVAALYLNEVGGS